MLFGTMSVHNPLPPVQTHIHILKSSLRNVLVKISGLIDNNWVEFIITVGILRLLLKFVTNSASGNVKLGFNTKSSRQQRTLSNRAQVALQQVPLGLYIPVN